MADSTKKKRRPKKPPIEMTNDELMERMFNKTVRKKLKKLAEDSQPKDAKDS